MVVGFHHAALSRPRRGFDSRCRYQIESEGRSLRFIVITLLERYVRVGLEK